MITIYTNPVCVQCENTKRYLTVNGVEFEVKDLASSTEVHPLIEEKGYKTAPVVVTDDDSWSGFNIGKLNALVEKEKGF
jgi:glutaredoxin-like protein NrdH